MWHSRNITLCVTWDDWCIRQAWCIRHTSHLPHQSYHLLTPCLISYLPLISYSHVWSAINTLSYQLFTRLISYLHVWSAIYTLRGARMRHSATFAFIQMILRIHTHDPSHSYRWFQLLTLAHDWVSRLHNTTPQQDFTRLHKSIHLRGACSMRLPLLSYSWSHDLLSYSWSLLSYSWSQRRP